MSPKAIEMIAALKEQGKYADLSQPLRLDASLRNEGQRLYVVHPETGEARSLYSEGLIVLLDGEEVSARVFLADSGTG